MTFSADLAAGQAHEATFHTLFPDLIRLDGRVADFKNSKGELVELKSDNYRHERSKNFFMERYSYRDINGGPFQSMQNGVTWYVYWFPKSHSIYVFNVNDLCGYLDWRFSEEGLIEVHNETWVTRGWKVPRESLAHLLNNPTEVLK